MRQNLKRNRLEDRLRRSAVIETMRPIMKSRDIDDWRVIEGRLGGGGGGPHL